MKSYDLDGIMKLLEEKKKASESVQDIDHENSLKISKSKYDDLETLNSKSGNTKKANLKTSHKIKEIESNDEKLTFQQEAELDKIKTKVLKYIFYKKRTEQEIKNKFSREFDKDSLEKVIERLKELGYISDSNYIERSVKEYIAINNLSIREIKYKLLTKGVKDRDIENYFFNNYYELLDFEIKSAKNIYQKKSKTMDNFEVKKYLIKKGYKEESIKEVL